MKTTRLLLASLLGASLAAFAFAGPGPQYWTQSAKNQQAQQVKIATETKTVADTAANDGFSMTYWEFCHTNFGIYDPKTKVWNKQLLEALIPPKQ